MRAPAWRFLALCACLMAPFARAHAKSSPDANAPPLPPARFADAQAFAAAVPEQIAVPSAPVAAASGAPAIDAALAARLAAARARWELGRDGLTPSTILPLVGPDGNIVAWDVDFRLDGQPLGSPADVCTQWWTLRGQAAARTNTFYSVTISADFDAPPVRASRRGPSNFYAAAPRLMPLAAQLLNDRNPRLLRVFPLSSWARAYEFAGGGGTIVLEGQEPWRWYEGEAYRTAQQARVAWRRQQVALQLQSKGPSAQAMAPALQTQHRATAERWLSGAMAPMQTTWIGQIAAFEPFYWFGGCSPTAGAMVLNYYDCRDEGDLGVGLLTRRYDRLVSPVTHTDNCRVPDSAPRLRVLMNTDSDGETFINDIRPGMAGYVEERGYCDGGGPDWLGLPGGWEWDGMTNEIDLSHPFVWSCDFYPGASTGHSVGVVGYESSAEDLLCYNTWFDGDVPELVHHAGGLFDWSSIDGVHPWCYQSQANIRLIAPLGRTDWVPVADCGYWGGTDAGCGIPVQWANSLSTNTRVQVFYSLDAGANWTFGAETDDDGNFDWIPPTWPCNSARVRVDRVQYEAGQPRLLASDASRGDFFIFPPAPHPCVVSTPTLQFASSQFGVGDMENFSITNTTCGPINGTLTVIGSSEFSLFSSTVYLERDWWDVYYVTYTPVDCGPDQAYLVLPGTPCANILLTAQGPTAPTCSVTPAQLAFAANHVGQSESKAFVLRNTRCGSLAGVLTPDDPDFTVAPSSFALGPGDSLRVTVTFTPADCMPDTCRIDTGALCQDVVCVATDVFTPGSWQPVVAGPLAHFGPGMGVAAGDYDADGDDDLYLSLNSAANALLRNDGGLVFADVTSGPLANSGPGYGAAWGDMDNDGDLDLYAANFGTSDVLLRNNGAAGFATVTGGGLGTTGQSVTPTWVDIDGDGDLDIYVTRYGTANLCLRNDGPGGFTRITTLPLADTGYGMDAAWGDWDNDGDPDVYLVNYGQADKLLRNDGGFNFVSVNNGPYGFDSGAGMGAAWGDCDNDGDLDLFLAKYGNANRLYYNDPNHTLRPAAPAPLSDTVAASSISWVDFDNDGDLDLYQFVYGAANRLYRQDGPTTWVNAAAGPIADAGAGYGQAWSDYDGEGRQDVYLHAYQAASVLCRNEVADPGCRNWVQVDLQGTVSNRHGVGARVRVVAGGRSQIREVGAGEGGMSQNSTAVAFGLGPASVLDSLVVRWPWRSTQVHTALPVNRRLTIVENGAVTDVPQPEPSRQLPVAALTLLPARPNPFNPSVTIPYALPRPAGVTLTVHDAAGRRVTTLVPGTVLAAGPHEIQWSGRDDAGRAVRSGVYYCRLAAAGEVRIGKLLLLR